MPGLRLAADEPPSAPASSIETEFAEIRRAFEEWEHPRGRDGRWINKFAAIKVFSDGNPKPRIATVQDLRPDGVHVVYADHTTGVVNHKQIEVINEKARLNRISPVKIRGVKDLHGAQLHEGDRAIYTGTGGNSHNGIVAGVTPNGDVRFHHEDGKLRVVKPTALRRNNGKEAHSISEGNKRRAVRADDKRKTQGQTPTYFYDRNNNFMEKTYVGNTFEKLFFMLGQGVMQRAFGAKLQQVSGAGDSREGSRDKNNTPLDFKLGDKYGVELKSMSLMAKEHKVGMRGDSLRLKQEQAKREGLGEMVIAQVVDQKAGVVRLYMYPKFGSPTLSRMTLIGEYSYTDKDLEEAMQRAGAPTLPPGVNPFVVPEHHRKRLGLAGSAEDWTDYDDSEIQPGDTFLYLDADGVPWIGTEPGQPVTAGLGDAIKAAREGDHVFKEWEHPRGRDGRWIDKGGFVKVFKSKDDHSTPKVGQVHDLTPAGVVVHTTDGQVIVAHPDQIEEEHAIARMSSTNPGFGAGDRVQLVNGHTGERWGHGTVTGTTVDPHDGETYHSVRVDSVENQNHGHGRVKYGAGEHIDMSPEELRHGNAATAPPPAPVPEKPPLPNLGAVSHHSFSDLFNNEADGWKYSVGNEGMNPSGFVTSASGQELFVKREANPDNAKGEVDAAALAQAVGIHAPTARLLAKDDGGGLGVVAHMAAAEPGYQLDGNAMEVHGNPQPSLADLKLSNPQDVLTLSLFDAAIDNGDRHPGNLMLATDVNGGYRLIPIDHGLAFGNSDEGSWHPATMLRQRPSVLSIALADYARSQDRAHLQAQVQETLKKLQDAVKMVDWQNSWADSRVADRLQTMSNELEQLTDSLLRASEADMESMY